VIHETKSVMSEGSERDAADNQVPQQLEEADEVDDAAEDTRTNASRARARLRAAETAEQRALVLARDRGRRTNESADHRERRLEAQRQRRANLSDDERARRRQLKNAAAARRRNAETAEQRQSRLLVAQQRRERETTEARARRLAAMQEINRSAAAARSSDQLAARANDNRARRESERVDRDALLASDDRLRELVAAGVPVPLDDETRESIERDASAALWQDRMDEGVCAVCDELVVLAELHDLEPRDGEALVDKMRTRLAAPPDLRALPTLLGHYRVAAPGVANFDNVLLSPRGVVHWASPNFAERFEPTRIRMCTPCRMSLQRGGAADTRPPKLNS
jgi:hypothetical protein